MYIKTSFCKLVKKSLLRTKEHPLVGEEFTLTRYCRKKSKNLDDQRITAQITGFLQAIDCPRDIGRKKNVERSRARQKWIKNG